MKPYEAWKSEAELERSESEHQAFWDDYFAKETEAYRAILINKSGTLNGVLSELAEGFHMTNAEFAGFLDGANTSFVTEAALDDLDETTPVSLRFDFEKLYYNMHKAKAEWLYTLREWDDVLSEAKRTELTRAFRLEGVYHRDEKRVGRNDPCPCGSGKKFKNCCGKNA